MFSYITDSVKEKLFAVTNVKSSTGLSKFKMTKETLVEQDIYLKNYIKSSTDGVSKCKRDFKDLIISQFCL